MRLITIVAAAILVSCRPQTELRGVYVSQDGSGILFPCDSVNVAFLVPDSVLAARYRTLSSPVTPAYVRLRGVKKRTGSIYDGRRYVDVSQVLELRPRAAGECPKVAHSATTVLPS